MPQVWSPVSQRLGNIIRVSSLNAQEVEVGESEVQGHLWLLREFKANLSYSRTWLSSQGSRLSVTHLGKQAISDSTALAYGTLTQKFSFSRIIGVLDIFPGCTDRERQSHPNFCSFQVGNEKEPVLAFSQDFVHQKKFFQMHLQKFQGVAWHLHMCAPSSMSSSRAVWVLTLITDQCLTRDSFCLSF